MWQLLRRDTGSGLSPQSVHHRAVRHAFSPAAWQRQTEKLTCSAGSSEDYLPWKLWPVWLHTTIMRDHPNALTRQSVVKAHLFFSAEHRASRRWKHSCQFDSPSRHAALSSSPSRLSDIDCFALLYLCTWPIHSISSTVLQSSQIWTVQPIPF